MIIAGKRIIMGGGKGMIVDQLEADWLPFKNCLNIIGSRQLPDRCGNNNQINNAKFDLMIISIDICEMFEFCEKIFN